MPIKTAFIDGIIHTELSGDLDYDTIIKHSDFIFSLRNKMTNLYELHDHTNTQSVSLSTDEMREIARYTQKMKDIFRHSFIAAYAPNDFTFGMGRMCQTLFNLAGNPIQAAIFRDKNAALQFLEQKMADYGQ